jgi:hypothetical protein
MTKKPWAKEQQMNWDMIIPQITSMWFKGENRITFDIPNSFFFIDEVEGQRVLGLHGHQVKGQLGVPWYGLRRIEESITASMAHVGKPINHVMMGHFHTEAIFDRVGGQVIANPCMKGADEYALGAGFKPSNAGQTMYGIHPRNGITHRWRINLQEYTEPTGLLKWWDGGVLGDL